MFSTILVPVDLAHKDWAESALHHVEGVDDDDVRIIMLHVVEAVPLYLSAQLPKDLLEQSVDRMREELEAFAAKAGRNIICEIGHGKPATIILQVAERLGADLIVIGAHRPGLRDYLMGSTAAKVVRHAKCSVLVSR